jgi:hypothetical protein
VICILVTLDLELQSSISVGMKWKYHLLDEAFAVFNFFRFVPLSFFSLPILALHHFTTVLIILFTIFRYGHLGGSQIINL